jgi:hypothetical protein
VHRRILALALTTTALFGAFTAGQNVATAPTSRTVATTLAAKSIIHEDSRNFDCRKRSNRTCGVRIDPTPNNGKKNFIRVNVVFNKKGQAVDAYPFGARR